MKLNNIIISSLITSFVIFFPEYSSAQDEKTFNKEYMIKDKIYETFKKNDIFNNIDGNVILDNDYNIYSNISHSDIENVIGETFSINTDPDTNDKVGLSNRYSIIKSNHKSALYIVNNVDLPKHIKYADYISKNELRQIINNDLYLLGFDNIEGLEISIRESMKITQKKGLPPSEPEAIAYKVFVYRLINGKRLHGPRIIMGYYLDGTLQKISLRWPNIIENKTGILEAMSEDEIIDNVYNQFKDYPLSNSDNEIKAEISTALIDGELRDVIYIRGNLCEDNKGRVAVVDIVF